MIQDIQNWHGFRCPRCNSKNMLVRHLNTDWQDDDTASVPGKVECEHCGWMSVFVQNMKTEYVLISADRPAGSEEYE